MKTTSLSRLLWQAKASLVPGVSWPTIATTVREHYERMVAPEHRLIVWSQNRDAYTRARMDAQTLRRFDAEAENRCWDFDLPADLVDAILLALRDLGYRYYGELEAQWALRRGRATAAIPSGRGPVMLYTSAEVMRESADTVRALADLETDGEINAMDRRTLLFDARHQAAELLGATAYVIQRIDEALEALEAQDAMEARRT